MKLEKVLYIFFGSIIIIWTTYSLTEGEGHKYWAYLKNEARKADTHFTITRGEADSMYEFEFVADNPEPSYFSDWYDTTKKNSRERDIPAELIRIIIPYILFLILLWGALTWKKRDKREEKKETKETKQYDQSTERSIKKPEQIIVTPIDNELKPLWKNIHPFLNSMEIEKFYHFTDRRNLQSIINNGGLHSWDSLTRNNIHTFTSSNELSRNLDIQYGLENYVRLSFTNYNPMTTRVISQEKRELIWLEIDMNVALLGDTLFSDLNATDNNVKISSDFNFLKSLNFNIFNKRWNTLNFKEKKEYQAEILVKEFLPIKYITNINTLREKYL